MQLYAWKRISTPLLYFMRHTRFYDEVAFHSVSLLRTHNLSFSFHSSAYIWSYPTIINTIWRRSVTRVKAEEEGENERMKKPINFNIFFSFLLCLTWWWKKRRKENGRIKFNIMPCILTSPFSRSFVLKSLFIQYTEKWWWRKKIRVADLERKFLIFLLLFVQPSRSRLHACMKHARSDHQSISYILDATHACMQISSYLLNKILHCFVLARHLNEIYCYWEDKFWVSCCEWERRKEMSEDIKMLSMWSFFFFFSLNLNAAQIFFLLEIGCFK